MAKNLPLMSCHSITPLLHVWKGNGTTHGPTKDDEFTPTRNFSDLQAPDDLYSGPIPAESKALAHGNGKMLRSRQDIEEEVDLPITGKLHRNREVCDDNWHQRSRTPQEFSQKEPILHCHRYMSEPQDNKNSRDEI